MEQLKIEGVEGFVSRESRSAEESFGCLLASHIAHGYTVYPVQDWSTAYPEITVEPSERKLLKIIGTAGIGKSLLNIQHILHLAEHHIDFARLLTEPDESPSEESRALRVGDFVPTPVSVENERLKSQLIATRRARLAARKTADRLAVENARLREINKTLQRAMGIQEAADIYLREAHVGIVSEVLGDQVEVTYETADGPLKQMYWRKQFMQGKLPKEGDKVEAHVMIAVIDREKDQTKETEFASDLPSFRDKAVSGPIRL